MLPVSGKVTKASYKFLEALTHLHIEVFEKHFSRLSQQTRQTVFSKELSPARGRWSTTPLQQPELLTLSFTSTPWRSEVPGPCCENPLNRPSPSTIPPSPPPPLPGISWHLLVSHHLSQDSLKKGAQISTRCRMLSQCRQIREDIQSHLVQSNYILHFEDARSTRKWLSMRQLLSKTQKLRKMAKPYDFWQAYIGRF